jgi:hypothetical protein
MADRLKNDSGDIDCDCGGSEQVFISTSPPTAGVRIKPYYNTAHLSFAPREAVTDANGVARFTVRCNDQDCKDTNSVTYGAAGWESVPGKIRCRKSDQNRFAVAVRSLAAANVALADLVPGGEAARAGRGGAPALVALVAGLVRPAAFPAKEAALLSATVAEAGDDLASGRASDAAGKIGDVARAAVKAAKAAKSAGPKASGRLGALIELVQGLGALAESAALDVPDLPPVKADHKYDAANRVCVPAAGFRCMELPEGCIGSGP